MPSRTSRAAGSAVVTLAGVLLGAANWSGLSPRDLFPSEAAPVQVPPPGALAFFAIALVSAAYTYYQLRQEIGELRDELSDERGKQEALDALVVLRNDAIDHLYAQQITEAELPAWIIRYEKWQSDVLALMRPHFAGAIVGMFTHLGIVVPEAFEQSVNDQHTRYLTYLAINLRNIERLVHENTRLMRITRGAR